MRFDTYYQQIFGTAMGSPVSAVMANLVMEDLEKRALSTSNVQPCFWKRYVDDVCAAVNSNLVQTLQHHLNNIDPSIQFTVERETNRKMSFLDVTVCRQDNGHRKHKSIVNLPSLKDICRSTRITRLRTRGLLLNL